MKQINSKILQKKRIVESSTSDLWWRWTSPEGLATFFSKNNKVELRLNGPYEIYFLMDNPYGLRGSEGCRIISFLPEKMLSFTWNAPPEYKEIRELKHETWVVIYFSAMGENRTEIELNHHGWLEGKKWDAVYDYFDKAWGIVLDWLEKSCTL